MRLVFAIALVAGLGLGGCAHTSTTAAAPAAGASDAEAQQKTMIRAKLKECDALLAQRKLEEANRCGEAVENSGGYKLGRWGSYTRVTALLYAGDFDGAWRVFAAMRDRDRAHGEAENEAWSYNATTWLRWGVHDLDGALAENEKVRTTVEAAAKMSDDDKRGVLLHYWWDRAYLLLDKGDEKAASEARVTYEKLARQPDQHDGLAVLAAWFAVKHGDGKSAREAARQVDPAKDDDVQDLYVLWLAYEAAGDRAAADDMRGRIGKGNEYPMKPLILRAMAEPKK